MALAERSTSSWAVREGSWKLIYFYHTKDRELYNVEEDVGETTNLARKRP